MKQLWIGLIVAGALAACRNGPNNARDTTGFGSRGTAGGSLPAEGSVDTSGLSGGRNAAPPPASSTSAPDTAKLHKKSHKGPAK